MVVYIGKRHLFIYLRTRGNSVLYNVLIFVPESGYNDNAILPPLLVVHVGV